MHYSVCLRLMCVPLPCWIKRVSGIDGFLRNTCCRTNCTDLENPTAVFSFNALISELTWDAYSLATVSRSAAMQCPTHPLEGGKKKNTTSVDVSNLHEVQYCSVTGFCRAHEKPLASFTTSKCALYREVHHDQLPRDIRRDRGASLFSIPVSQCNRRWVRYQPSALVFCSRRGRGLCDPR